MSNCFSFNHFLQMSGFSEALTQRCLSLMFSTLLIIKSSQSTQDWGGGVTNQNVSIKQVFPSTDSSKCRQAAIQACPQILDNDLHLRVKDNVVDVLILQRVPADQRLMIKYVCVCVYPPPPQTVVG